MGALRTIGLISVAILFFVGILATNSLFVIVNSLDYENVKEDLINVVKEVVLEKALDFSEDDFDIIKQNCVGQSEYALETDETDLNLTVPCEIVNEGQDALLDYYAESLTSQIYEKNYECEFFDCASEEESPFFLFSKNSHDYWKSKFNLALGFTIFLFILMFLLVEKKANSLIIAGVLMIISGLPLLLGEVIMESFMGEFLEFLDFIVSNAYWTAIKVFAFAVVLIGFGILWRVFNIGMWVSGKFGGGEKKVIQEKVVEPAKE